jgi:hypothetical protein
MVFLPQNLSLESMVLNNKNVRIFHLELEVYCFIEKVNPRKYVFRTPKLSMCKFFN